MDKRNLLYGHMCVQVDEAENERYMTERNALYKIILYIVAE